MPSLSVLLSGNVLAVRRCRFQPYWLRRGKYLKYCYSVFKEAERICPLIIFAVGKGCLTTRNSKKNLLFKHFIQLAQNLSFHFVDVLLGLIKFKGNVTLGSVKIKKLGDEVSLLIVQL